ncbi:MAG: patatin-like phospholipase family protein, partial [Acidobacteriota bacterium]
MVEGPGANGDAGGPAAEGPGARGDADGPAAEGPGANGDAGGPAADGREVHPRVALVLTGGGARGAYQVGVLRGLGRLFPEARFRLITGVSAGAINAIYLALRPEALGEASRRLGEIWRHIEIDRVVKADWSWLTSNFFRWGAQLGLGGLSTDARALLDASPLEDTLRGFLCDPDGRIGGIRRNLKLDRLDAVAVATVNYTTGQTVHWVQGRDIRPWRAANRLARQTEIELRHIMASSALPLIFPAVELDDGWYGDGGIRLAAPLSPALHLGAERLLAVSTRYLPTDVESAAPTFTGYPSPAQIGGHLMNAIFLDVLDQDVARLRRTNALLEPLAPEDRGGLRPIQLEVVRPSADLGAMASDFVPRLPKGLRFL